MLINVINVKGISLETAIAIYIWDNEPEHIFSLH